MKMRKMMICLMVLLMGVALLSTTSIVIGAVIEDEDAAPVKKEAKPKAAKKKAKKVEKVEEVEEAEPAAEPAVEAAPASESPSAPGEKPSRTKKVTAYPFYIYQDGAAKANHFYPSGWMGDYGDLRVNVKEMVNPHSAPSCAKISYTAKGKNGAGWAGVYWQQPANNWGTANAGYDLSGAKRLTFWARGEKGNEVINEFKVGGIQGEYADTDVAGIGPVKLTTAWKQYTIDLAGKDLSRIAGGFCWAASADENPDGFAIYLDDIMFEQ
ncbi:MAG: hypothetical protein PHH44_08215 [bacterium]|nr:hypothetical protein [bacterium]